MNGAPRVIELLDRLGVPFNRTSEGFLDRRRFGGTLYKRTAFAGATTGQQLLYALDEQVRRWEVAGLVEWPVVLLGDMDPASAGTGDDSDIPAETISVMCGHQLPFLSCLVPLYMVKTMCTWRQTLAVWPALSSSA